MTKRCHPILFKTLFYRCLTCYRNSFLFVETVEGKQLSDFYRARERDTADSANASDARDTDNAGVHNNNAAEGGAGPMENAEEMLEERAPRVDNGADALVQDTQPVVNVEQDPPVEQNASGDEDDSDAENSGNNSDSSSSSRSRSSDDSSSEPDSERSSQASPQMDPWLHGEVNGPYAGIWQKIHTQSDPPQPPPPEKILLDHLKEIHQTRMHTDIMFMFPGGETLEAHKLILAMRCKLFEDMFYGENAKNVTQVMIDDADVKTFEAFLMYLYTDETKLVDLSPEQVMQYLQLAGKYNLNKLKNEVATFLEITLENVCQLHERGKSMNVDTLSIRTKDYMCKHIDGLARLDDISLTLESVLELVSNENLGCLECDIFQFAYRWSEHECVRKGIEVNTENRREVLGKAFYEIRFPVMDSIDLTMLVGPTNILSPQEQKELFQFFISRTNPTRKLTGRVLNFHSLPRKGLEMTITIPRKKQNSPAEDVDAAMRRIGLAMQGGGDNAAKPNRTPGRGSKHSHAHRKLAEKNPEPLQETAQKFDHADWGGFPRIVLSTTHKIRLVSLKQPLVVFAHMGNIEIHYTDDDANPCVETISKPEIYYDDLHLYSLKLKSEIIVPPGKDIHIVFKSNEINKDSGLLAPASAGSAGIEFSRSQAGPQFHVWEILKASEGLMTGEFCCSVSVIPWQLDSLTFCLVD